MTGLVILMAIMYTNIQTHYEKKILVGVHVVLTMVDVKFKAF